MVTSLEWNELDVDGTTRMAVVKRPCDFEANDWAGLYGTAMEWLYAMRAAVLSTYGGQ